MAEPAPSPEPHDGVLRISGTADRLEVERLAELRGVNASSASREHPRSDSNAPAPTWASGKLEAAVARTQAKAALGVVVAQPVELHPRGGVRWAPQVSVTGQHASLGIIESF
jgi:hypothetical protein